MFSYNTTPFLDKKERTAIEENLKVLFSYVGYNLFSNIQTYSISKLGFHHDLTINKFECTPFKNMFSNIQTYSSLSSKLGVHHDLTLNKFECTI
jgi:hypothetical protein